MVPRRGLPFDAGPRPRCLGQHPARGRRGRIRTHRARLDLLPNDLHKGRNTGPAWAWFIDVFAIACIVFTVTGLFLLQMHARQRPTTWPWVGLGLLVPVLLALIFVH